MLHVIGKRRLRYHSRSDRSTNIEEAAHDGSLIDALPDDLTEALRDQTVDFIRRHGSLFSSSEFDIGRTPMVQHRIDTGTNRPFRQQLRRHPLAYLPVIDEHVEQMLAHDIVEPAASPWASNVVLIRKSDGQLRFCVDYRHLNDLTYKDSYPLPRIDACLHSLGGAKYFSTLDLRAGYCRLRLLPSTAIKPRSSPDEALTDSKC